MLGCMNDVLGKPPCACSATNLPFDTAFQHSKSSEQGGLSSTAAKEPSMLSVSMLGCVAAVLERPCFSALRCVQEQWRQADLGLARSCIQIPRQGKRKVVLVSMNEAYMTASRAKCSMHHGYGMASLSTSCTCLSLLLSFLSYCCNGMART